MSTIGIIDYGVGNVRSIQNMLWKIDIASELISSQKELSKYKKIILPGVGAYDTAVSNLQKANLFNGIKSFSEDGYILGICLGMQLLADSSEEGGMMGLGLIPGKVMKFDSKRVSVPHIGWNYVDYKDDIFTRNLDSDQRYFFVHSYFYECADKKNSVGCTNYDDKFTSVVSNNVNVFGTQFHPEKSHIYGKNLLKNYYEIY